MPDRPPYERTQKALQRESVNLCTALNASEAAGDTGRSWHCVCKAECDWNFHVEDDLGHNLLIDLRDADRNASRKYTVTVSWPGGRTHRFNAPDDNKSFGCNYDRGTDALVQTIQKRVMPYVIDHWQDRVDVVQKIEDDEDSRLAAANRLRARFGRDPSTDQRDTVSGTMKTGIHRVQLNNDGSRATVDITRQTLPIETVFELIDWLEAHQDAD